MSAAAASPGAPAAHPGEGPILILAPLRNDARLTAEFLAGAGFEVFPCAHAEELCERFEAGCGALLIAEEALDGDAVVRIGALLAAQPDWSDLPVAIITSGGEVSFERRSRLAALGPSGNVILIERPFRPATLISTMQVALRSRRRQIQVRDLLVQARRDAEVRRAGEERYRELARQIARQSRIYETTLSSTVDLLYVFDLDGRFLYTNHGLPTLLGRGVSEVVGKNFLELDYPPELAAKLTRQIRQVIELRAPVRDETLVTNAHGTFAFEYIFAPVLGADGGVEAVAGSSRDITERQQIQHALEEQAATLRETDRRKDEFVAMLAHELRNPLSSIGNAVSLLKEEHAEEKRTWAVDVIARQSGQLGRLVDDLLDVSRITRGKIELRKSVLDAATCLESACEAVAPLIAERAHTLLATVPRGELWLEADPTRLEQVVVNLLANAAKYTEPHGRICLSARRTAGEIVVEVRDSGIGVAPGKMDGLFELFAQGERTIARSEGGLGIGLTVVRGLCEMHGGSIVAHSPGPGQGSVFTVHLPAAPAPAETPPAARPMARGATGVQVLVVDDNVDTATGLALLLRRRGHRVELAHDGPAALAAAAATAPQVVLLDIGLPGMTGYQVASALRAQPGGGAALIIALSGYGQEEDRRLSGEAGFDHHLVKPVDFEEVNALVSGRAWDELKGIRLR